MLDDFGKVRMMTIKDKTVELKCHLITENCVRIKHLQQGENKAIMNRI